MRRAARKDENHSAIRTAFRKMLGIDNVRDLSQEGLGDLLIAHGGVLMMVEIKTAKGKLTKLQTECNLPRRLVRNMDDVAETVNVLRRWHNAITADSLNRTAHLRK